MQGELIRHAYKHSIWTNNEKYILTVAVIPDKQAAKIISQPSCVQCSAKRKTYNAQLASPSSGFSPGDQSRSRPRGQ